MFGPHTGLGDLCRVTDARTRSISAENPDGRKSGGAQARPGDDPWCSDAASALGRGWKVRPCARDIQPGQEVVLADVRGPGVIQHIWCTVLHGVQRELALEVYYDDAPEPSICTPLGDFFANGLNGAALVNSQPVVVAPKGGMNAYWPMPFRERIRIVLRNDGHKTLDWFFYQITWAEQDVPEDAGYLHATWRRDLTTRDRPEHVILEGLDAAGHYVGTYLAWNQLSNGWWGEGEVKFFIDDDPDDAPTICGTGTEDYFGGAWGFVMDHDTKELIPETYSTPYLGYHQFLWGKERGVGPRVPAHGLYRWHIPDPIRFARNLRVTVQALGWWPGEKYQPLTDDIASTAYLYLQGALPVPRLPSVSERYPR